MIAGEACEVGGEVVDEDGATLVVRTARTDTNGRTFHRAAGLDPETGKSRPACESRWPGKGKDVDWLLRRRTDLEPQWSGCSFGECFGSYDPCAHPRKSGHNGLAARLEEMTVAEFDALVGGDA